MDVISRMVVRLNVEYFRKKLAEETDERVKQTLLHLLGEEEAKLKSLIISLEGHRQRRALHNVGNDRQGRL